MIIIVAIISFILGIGFTVALMRALEKEATETVKDMERHTRSGYLSS